MENVIENILNHHLASFGKADMAEILSDYTEKSVVITPDRVARGLDEIQGIFESLLEMVPPGSNFSMDAQAIEGNVAYIVWNAENSKVKIPLGTDTFWIDNHKIMLQTLAAYVHPGEKNNR